jgi:hypothetical protein
VAPRAAHGMSSGVLQTVMEKISSLALPHRSAFSWPHGGAL